MSRTEIKNESALVIAARQGDSQSLQRLLEKNWTWLKGLVYNVLGDIHDVDDALQEICVLVIRKIPTLREPERFRPWLATLAKRAALAWRMKQSRQPNRLGEITAAQLSDTGADSLCDKAAQNEQYQRILEAVRLLPEKYREVFILKYMEDLSYADIAEILDITVTTVQIRLVRARRMIYNRLTGKPTDKVPRT